MVLVIKLQYFLRYHWCTWMAAVAAPLKPSVS